jgi:hypothetical protein
MPNVLGYAADTVQIPETTPTGQGIPSFRDLFPFITQVDPDAGGVMVERAWMNALFNLLGQHAFFQQSGCVYPWQATLNYIAGSHVKGSDDVEYIALQPSGPDVSGTGAKDPAQQANRAYWVSLESFVSGDFVPNSRRVIAGTGLTGGGPLSTDVTLAAKLTDSVSLADSTTAASAKAVKTAYDLANSKAQLGFTPVQQGGGTGQNNTKIYIGSAGVSGLKAQQGTTDLGNIVTTTAGTTRAPSATKVYVEKFGEMSWIYTQYANSPANVWCLPANSDYAHLCSPSVLSVGASQLTITSPNTRIFQTNGSLPAGGSWVVIVSRNGNGVVAQLAGGSSVDTSGGVALAIRVQ